MLIEPALDRGLAAALNREYWLAVGAVRFIPMGETAWCYQMTDERGRRWFLKLSWPGAIDPVRPSSLLSWVAPSPIWVADAKTVADTG